MSVPGQEGLRMVVFDSGDARCLSQLEILEEILYQVQWKMKRSDPLLPCEYLHMIGGVGPAGIIVAFLIVFRMSIQEAKDEFVNIWLAVFTDKACTPASRSAILESKLADLIKHRNIPAEGQFLFNTPNDGCKGFVCSVSPDAMSACQLFRTYASRQRGTKVTIIEAIRATCANTTLFDVVKVGKPPQQQAFISGDITFSNPIRQALKEALNAYGPDKKVSCIISLGAGKTWAVKAQDLQTVDPFYLSSVNAARTAEELEAQLGNSGVYYRFAVDHNLELPDSVPNDHLRLMFTYTKSYLLQERVSQEIEKCVEASEVPSNMTLQDLYRTDARKIKATHGLPPLCASFVNREGLMESMTQSLFSLDAYSQRIMVLSGMGGSGKTQMIAKFARAHSDRFRHILFIDASTTENIKNGLISKVRTLGGSCKTVGEALDYLASSQHHNDGHWLAIFDNADNPNINLSQFFPSCDFGFILITTRNPTLGALSPNAHIEVDVMTEHEAVEVLLRSAHIGPTHSTDDQRKRATEIAKELEFLPVALVQAGSFIKMNQCLDTYIERLRKNRKKILNRPAQAQLDKHHHGIYATLDVTKEALSLRSQQFLSLLACFNYSGFPLALIGRAAQRTFTFEPYDLLPRSTDFDEIILILDTIFRPERYWDEQDLDDLLVELEQYSLLARVHEFSRITLRFHPLVHAWMFDQVLGPEAQQYQAAAFRLLVCGTCDEDEDIYDLLLPQMALFSVNLQRSHVNDLAGVAKLALWEGNNTKSLDIWENIYREVTLTNVISPLHISRAQLQLARVEAVMGNLDEAERMIGDVIKLRVDELTYEHTETMEAVSLLAEKVLFARKWKIDNLRARKLQNDAVQYWRKTSTNGQPSFCTLRAMEVLAQMCQKNAQIHGQTTKWEESYRLFKELLYWRDRLYGADHIWTLRTRELIASFWAKLDYTQHSTFSDIWGSGDSVRAGLGSNNDHMEDTLRDIIVRRVKAYGPYHTDSMKAKISLAEFYTTGLKYDKAAIMWVTIIQGWNQRHGLRHPATIKAIESLAKVHYERSNYEEAIMQWKLVVEACNGAYHEEAVAAMRQMAAMYEYSKQYGKARNEWGQIISRYKSMDTYRHESLVDAMRSLARLGEVEQDYNQAIKDWESIIRECDSSPHSWDEEALEALEAIARVYGLQRKYQEAEECWKDLHERCKKELPFCLQVNHLSEEDQKKWHAAYRKALPWYERSINYWVVVIQRLRTEFGSRREETLRARETLARVYEWQGRHDLLENVWQEIATTRESVNGICHAATLRAKEALDCAQEISGRIQESREIRELLMTGRGRIQEIYEDRCKQHESAYKTDRECWEQRLYELRRQEHENKQLGKEKVLQEFASEELAKEREKIKEKLSIIRMCEVQSICEDRVKMQGLLWTRESQRKRREMDPADLVQLDDQEFWFIDDLKARERQLLREEREYQEGRLDNPNNLYGEEELKSRQERLRLLTWWERIMEKPQDWASCVFYTMDGRVIRYNRLHVKKIRESPQCCLAGELDEIVYL